MMLWIGVYSTPFLSRMEASLEPCSAENRQSARPWRKLSSAATQRGQSLRRTDETMMKDDLILLMPQLILIVAGMALMLLEPFTAPGRKSRMGRIAVLATAAAMYGMLLQPSQPPRTIFHGMLILDNFSLFFFQYLFLIIAGISASSCRSFNERESIERGEYYALLLFACCGMSLMALSGDLILTFLGIEILRSQRISLWIQAVGYPIQ
jgi:hypothetical protein